MNADEILKAARAISRTGPNITYPSSGAAEHVRAVVRGLLSIIRGANDDPRPGRDTTAAAKTLASGEDAWLQMVALHDPSMIRDVAAALLLERTS